MAGGLALRNDAETAAQRTVCSFCSTHIDPATVECAAVPSDVRAFKHEIFHIWRCPACRSLHCLENVDLRRYYTNYPIARTLSVPSRLTFENLLSRLTRHAYRYGSRLLDYGCGSGAFLEHLRERGYVDAAGYDPYSSVEGFRDRSRLKPAAFDYVLAQDVVGRVDDPRALFAELDRLVTPGGFVLVGTATADDISLNNYTRHWTQLHPPYHLHIYTQAALERLSAETGWAVLERVDRPYYDTKAKGLNAWTLTQHRWLTDGTLDASFEKVPETFRPSVRFALMAYFGYWYKRRTGEIAILFRKPAVSETHLPRVEGP